MTGHNPMMQRRQLPWPPFTVLQRFRGLPRQLRVLEIKSLPLLTQCFLFHTSIKCANWLDYGTLLPKTYPGCSVPSGTQFWTQSLMLILFLEQYWTCINATGTLTTTEFWGDYCWPCKALVAIYRHRDTLRVLLCPVSLKAAQEVSQKAMGRTLKEKKSQESKASDDGVLG